jgi:hypothetical protein
MDFLIDHFWSTLVCIHPTITIWLATTNKPIQLIEEKHVFSTALCD